jgi:hypothetical protein
MSAKCRGGEDTEKPDLLIIERSGFEMLTTINQ